MGEELRTGRRNAPARSKWGTNGLYQRHVYVKDEETGKPLLNARGQKVIAYTYWQASFELPEEDLPEGVQRRRITGNGASKTEAQRRLRENIDEFYRRKRDGEPMYRTPRKRGVKRWTIADLFEDWLLYKQDEDITATVLKKYRGMYELHIKEPLGAKHLDKITFLELNQFINSTLPAKKKITNGRKTQLLSSAARLNIWKLLRMVFLYAERTNKMGGQSNPMKMVKQVKVQKPIIDIDARVQDAEDIMIYMRENRPELVAQIGLTWLGLRQSERLGLCVSDFIGLDTKHPKMIVRHQLQRRETSELVDEITGEVRHRWHLAPTKTRKERVIPLVEPFLTDVKEHIARRKEYLAALEKNPGTSEYLAIKDTELGGLMWLNERGTILSRNRDNEIWQEVCTAAGVVPYPGHKNRHITAARLATLDPPISAAVLREILGHESEAINFYYQKITSANSEQAMNRYGQYIRNSQQNRSND